jgi:hypothetical protein
MNRLPTPIQANYPVPEDFVVMARRWQPDAIENMLGYVWQGFDTLLEEENFDLSKAEESLERDISFIVCQKIRDAMDGKPPYYLEHLPPENEMRASAQAAPPTPDLGFIWIHNPRAIFPLEAKILPTDRKIGKYVKEIKENFLTGRYASFSSEAAMLGYLLNGKVESAFENISTRLNCTLKRYPPYKERNHWFSLHKRKENGTGSSRNEFMCHHMIIFFGLCIG